MAKYYNVTRGPLVASLSDGRSVSIPPKSWMEVAAGDEGAASVSALVRKGFLKRSTLPTEPEVVAAPIAAPTVSSVPTVVSTIAKELVVDLDRTTLSKSETKPGEVKSSEAKADAEAEAKKK